MDLELISTRRCPFVQRSIITLKHKNVPHKVTYIDVYDPPDWFKAISPLGKVPVLRVDGDTVLFESAVINEYLDEVTPGSLHPEDPLKRALNRSWIAFAGESLTDSYGLMIAKDKAAYQDKLTSLRSNLERIETQLGDGPFFNGSDFSLIDASYAPLFIRMGILRDIIGIDAWEGLPKVSAWAEALLAVPAVASTKSDDLADLYRDLMKTSGGYAADMLERKL